MATVVPDSGVSAEENLKKTPEKKMKMVTGAVALVLEGKVTDISDSEGSIGSCGSEKDHFYSDDEAIEADNEGDADVGTNTGWADAMAKVFNKRTPESKPTILVKNKLEKKKEKLKQEKLEKIKQHDKRLEWETMCRVKPDQRDGNLQRIATRGVVQLCNAVQKHQKNVDEKVKDAESSIRKCAKLISTVSEKDFINVLRGMGGSTNETTSSRKKPKTKQAEVKSEEGLGWTILCDEFMMGASMKDWGKESDGPDDSRPECASDSDT
uniref:RRP15-like protein n=1 Tax=Aotus nancymaae TaxID=37293 RepID=A0A2K5F390_AOTNA